MARQVGAAGVELLHEEWSGHRLRLERGRTVAKDEPSGSRLRVRVWLEGGREGRADGPLSSGAALIDQAMLAAGDAEDSDVQGPMGRLAAVLGGLGIDDRRYGSIEDEDRLEVLQTAERAAKAVDRRIVPGAFWYEDRRCQRSFANSKGVELEEIDTTYHAGCTVSVAGEKGSVVRTFDGRTFSTVASLPFGSDAARTAIACLKRGTQLSGPVRVLLEPEATAALVAALGQGFTNARVDGDGFFLSPAGDGEPVVDERLHLVDDGTIPGALRTASFDDRGVAPVALVLLREGRVDGRFLGVSGAREIEARPTGHLVDGKLRPRNLALRSGSRSINVMLNEATEPLLYIHQLPDLGGLDLATGKVRIPVSGAVMKGHEAIGGMTDATLVGDLMEVLNSVVEVASNTDRVGHVDAPAILLDGFTIE